jgi:hypothetical protein
MKKIIASALLGLLFFCGNLQAQVIPKNWTCHKDDQFNLSICYPNDWRFDDTTQGARFFIFSPRENKDDEYSQNFNLQARKMEDQTLTLEKYVAGNVDEIKKGIKNFNQLGSRYLIVNGVRWYELIYSGNIDEVDYPLKFRQRFTLYRGNAFVITYSTVGGAPDAFNETAIKVLNMVTL